MKTKTLGHSASFKLTPFLVSICLILAYTSSFSQVVTVAIVDTTFASAMGGKVETSLGDYDDEVTDLDVLFDSKITVCGKVGTPLLYSKQFGMIRLNANGTFDSSFGINGKAVYLWGESDYPNDMYLPGDGSIYSVGVSLENLGDPYIASVFKLKSNGMPDSTFGNYGRALFDLYPADTRLASMFPQDTAYIGCGSILHPNYYGFFAIRFHPNGLLDSSFGIAGKAILPINVHSSQHGVYAVNGFATKNTISFIGVTDSLGFSIVILGRLLSNGTPDPSFGTNGIINTGIIISNGGTIQSAMQQDFKINAVLPIAGPSNTLPWTIARFTTSGVLDSTYGTNGFVVVPIADSAKCYGMNVANNGKTVINGSAVGPLEQSASARIDLQGLPDKSFNRTGMAVVDVDKGLYSNYLTRYVGIGLKRYMAVGGSIQNGRKLFLVARFKDDTIQNGAVNMQGKRNLTVTPNPAQTIISIDKPEDNEPIDKITICDALGRLIYTKQSPLSNSNSIQVDISELPNGIYYCTIQQRSSIGYSIRFIVAH